MKRLFFYLSTCILFFSASAFADQPIESPDSLPLYVLKNFRSDEDRFGRRMVTCDYERIRKGNRRYQIKFAVRTENGVQHIVGTESLWDDESGDISLSEIGGFSRFFGGEKKVNYEIYLTTQDIWAGKSIAPILISNLVRMGNPGPATKARPMNEAEKEAYEKHILDMKPPAGEPPEGFDFATFRMKLPPGLPVMAGRYGKWQKAEFLGFNSKRLAKVRFIGEAKIITRTLEKCIAAKPDDIAMAKENPAAFHPSGRSLVDGTLFLPDDASPVDPSIKLIPGTPLLSEWGGEWHEVVVRKRTGTKFSTRMIDFPHLSQTLSLKQLAISDSIAEQLKQPGIETEFAKNLKGVPPSMMETAQAEFSKHMSGFGNDNPFEEVTDYPIRARVPKHCMIVPDDVAIPRGTIVAACFQLSWSPAEVITEHSDGTLDIDWQNHAAVWNGRVNRKQTIITKKALLKIMRDARKVVDLTKTARLWTDASGDHKINATFVGKTDEKVTLRLASGREKTIPIAKLCEDDQELLSRVKAPVENPFE